MNAAVHPRIDHPIDEGAYRGVDLDHTSFAVPDALATARILRRELGATPVAGETLPDFRYLLLHVGTADAGARLELLEPVGEAGFLSRFLHKHGPGPHHITFTVPDLRSAVARARDAGATVVGEDYDHEPWTEAFVLPDTVHGVVIQLASSTRTYPTPRELLASTRRTPQTYPSSRGATDPLWWQDLWNTPPGPPAVAGATVLRSTDLTATRAFFEHVLQAATAETPDGLHLTWPSGTLLAVAAAAPGVHGVHVLGGPPRGIPLGSATLGGPLAEPRLRCHEGKDA